MSKFAYAWITLAFVMGLGLGYMLKGSSIRINVHVHEIDPLWQGIVPRSSYQSDPEMHYPILIVDPPNRSIRKPIQSDVGPIPAWWADYEGVTY